MEIKDGDIGYEVVDVQQRLAALGYDLGPTSTDGFYGRHTVTAVRAFQADRGLKVTGVVTEKTWRRMVDATFKLGSRALYLRSPYFHGDDVRQLQLWLNSIGFMRDSVDGIFGPSSEKAVREFQENVGLAGDGIVGPSTIAALNNFRSILDQNADSVFAFELPPDSVVSLLQDRKIAVGCLTPHKQDWLSPIGNQQLLCADLAHRLSNLLETLGAEANLFKIQPKPEIEGEVAIFFEPGKKAVPRESLGVSFDEADAPGSQLAALVVKELENSLSDQIEKVVQTARPGCDLPTVRILTGEIEALSTGETVQIDVLKQKIAGAIFDGLKEFFALHN